MSLPSPKHWNPADFGRLAVLMGGTSAEREISLHSGRAVLAACQRLGLDVVGLDLGERPLAQLAQAAPDWTFNLVHGGYGENGQLAAAMELMGTGQCSCSASAMLLAMHKHHCKALWRARGLPTPNWTCLTPRPLDAAKQAIATAHIACPLVIKPTDEGSSVGLFMVHSQAQLDEALSQAMASYPQVLVESMIEGEEITMGVVGRTVLPCIHIQPDGGVYDYHAKYQSSNTRMRIPTGLGKELEAAAARLALAAFDTLGCTVWARVDAMVDRHGDIYLIELNTLPGMTDHSLVPCAAKALGMNFDQLVMALLQAAAGDGSAAGQ